MSEGRFITAADVMADLGVGRNKAYRILRQCTRLVDGGIVRVTAQAYVAWKARRTIQGECESPDAPSRFTNAESTGTASSKVVAKRPARPTTTRLSPSPQIEIDPFELEVQKNDRRITMPRTKPRANTV